MRAIGACLALVLAFPAVASAQWSVTLQGGVPPESDLQLQLGAGPALVLHGGHGESLLTRSGDLGFTAMGDAGVRLGRRLELVVGAQNYRFTSRFLDPRSQPSTPVYRSEWLVLSGLRFKL